MNFMLGKRFKALPKFTEKTLFKLRWMKNQAFLTHN
jgi:hypothetical protein